MPKRPYAASVPGILEGCWKALGNLKKFQFACANATKNTLKTCRFKRVFCLNCVSHMKKIFLAFGRWELNPRNSQKVGSDCEPSWGRLQPNRRAERDFLRKRQHFRPLSAADKERKWLAQRSVILGVCSAPKGAGNRKRASSGVSALRFLQKNRSKRYKACSDVSVSYKIDTCYSRKKKA